MIVWVDNISKKRISLQMATHLLDLAVFDTSMDFSIILLKLLLLYKMDKVSLFSNFLTDSSEDEKSPEILSSFLLDQMLSRKNVCTFSLIFDK